MISHEFQVCKKCVMPNTRPRVVFDSNGICNACLNAEEKKRTIDWSHRLSKFKTFVNTLKPKNSKWDCVVPWSGGKDSSSIAHKLKFEFGLNPLLVTFSPMIPNEVGAFNRELLLNQGFDHIYMRPNQKVMRHLARRFFIERGNPKVCWDAGVNSVPLQIACRYEIPLVFYAEHGESEYGGKVLSEESKMVRDFTEVIEHQIGDDPQNWVDETVSHRDLEPYLYPASDLINSIGLKALYFSYFFEWSMFRNYEYIREHIPFQTSKEGRTTGTFTDFDSLDDKIDDLYYYMQFIKFGFGRCVRDASRLIQNNHISREKALEYVELYDGEFPSRWLNEVLEYLKLNYREFIEIIDRHRNPEIWEYSNKQWKLKINYLT